MKNLHADMVHLPQEVVTVLLMYGTETTKRGCIRFFSIAFSDLRGQIILMVLHQLLNFHFSLQYSKYPTSIAALSFSRDGRLLAVASSYTFEEGLKP
jgi:hypothetical protein